MVLFQDFDNLSFDYYSNRGLLFPGWESQVELLESWLAPHLNKASQVKHQCIMGRWLSRINARIQKHTREIVLSLYTQ